jgi:hypothetical protein
MLVRFLRCPGRQKNDQPVVNSYQEIQRLQSPSSEHPESPQTGLREEFFPLHQDQSVVQQISIVVLRMGEFINRNQALQDKLAAFQA